MIIVGCCCWLISCKPHFHNVLDLFGCSSILFSNVMRYTGNPICTKLSIPILLCTKLATIPDNQPIFRRKAVTPITNPLFRDDFDQPFMMIFRVVYNGFTPYSIAVFNNPDFARHPLAVHFGKASPVFFTARFNSPC